MASISLDVNNKVDVGRPSTPRGGRSCLNVIVGADDVFLHGSVEDIRGLAQRILDATGQSRDQVEVAA